MRKRVKLIFAVVLILAISLMFVGCSRSSTVERQVAEENTAYVPVTGTCSVSVADDKVTVSAETDIIDSAIVALSVTDVQGNVLDELKIIKNGDNLSADFPIGADWGDEIYGFLTMEVETNGKQPDGVLSVYGAKFGNIESEYLLYDGKVNMVVIPSDKISIK